VSDVVRPYWWVLMRLCARSVQARVARTPCHYGFGTWSAGVPDAANFSAVFP
jgi:hypothetical protein